MSDTFFDGDFRALLAAVRARPDDPAPQLLLADWLDDAGSPTARDWAELLRLDRALSDPELPPEQVPELAQRAATLRLAHRPAAMTPPEDRCRVPCQVRGFSAALGRWHGTYELDQILTSDFQAHFAAGTAWVDRLEVRRAAPEQLIALANAPLLLGVGELELEIPACDGRGLSAIEAFAGRPLAYLRVLELTDSYCGDAGARFLAAAAGWTGLAVLRLKRCDLGDAGAAALAWAPHLAGLIELTLAGNAVGTAGVQALAASPLARSLEVLHLGGNPLGNHGARELAAGTWPRLEKLTLARCHVGKIGARDLAAARGLGALKRLDVRDNPLTAEGLERLRRAFGKSLRV